VKVLFDANTPVPLARALRGHAVTCAQELGWQGLENGALLDAAEQAGFDVLVTCDQNVGYQQNFKNRKLAVAHPVNESLAELAPGRGADSRRGRLRSTGAGHEN
jgi:hypothetical protein